MSLGGGRIGDAGHHRALTGPIGERIYGLDIAPRIPRQRSYADGSSVVRAALEGARYAEAHPLPVTDMNAKGEQAGTPEDSRAEMPSEVMDLVLEAAQGGTEA